MITTFASFLLPSLGKMRRYLGPATEVLNAAALL